MRRRNQLLFHFLTALLLVVLLHACGFPADSGGDQERPPQTRIIDVQVQPDTVAPGDTTSFTCIIEDSTDKRFNFYWYINQGDILGADFIGGDNNDVYRSEINRIDWIAPTSRGLYQFTVFANNGSKDSISVQDGFTIAVE